MIIIFSLKETDEQLYLDWVRANQDGIVANVGRNQEEVFLHKANCSFVSSIKVAKDGFIGSQYYKICAPQSDAHELIRWLRCMHASNLYGDLYDHNAAQCNPHLIGRVKNRS